MTQVFSFKLTLAAVALASTFGGSSVALAADGAALAKSSNCLVCHSVDTKKIGPAFKDVAAKYQGQADAPAMLAAKIQKGGSGNWGKTPMPPNPKVDDATAKELVAWILSAK